MGCTQSNANTALRVLRVVVRIVQSVVGQPAPAADAPPAHAPSHRKEDEIQTASHVAPGVSHLDSFGHAVDENGARVWPAAYYEARREAEHHAHERGRCYDMSKIAFSEDRHGEAKTLSDEGKKHGHLMEEANERAVACILAPQHLDKASKIDLHGLHKDEAVDATRSFVRSCIGKHNTVEVITGQGLHSDKSKGPVIKGAILDMCKKEGWQIDANEHNPGSFELIVPSS